MKEMILKNKIYPLKSHPNIIERQTLFMSFDIFFSEAYNKYQIEKIVEKSLSENEAENDQDNLRLAQIELMKSKK